MQIKRVVACAATLFVSCEDNTEALKRIKQWTAKIPLGTAKNIRMVYTDSIKDSSHFNRT